MSFDYSLRQLTFSDGTSIQLGADDIVVLVGANNAGKSVALRDIVDCIDSPGAASAKAKVIKTVDLSVSTEAAALESFCAELEQPAHEAPTNRRRMGALIDAQNLVTYGSTTKDVDWLRRSLRSMCVYAVSTEQRLTVSNPMGSIDLASESKSHPFHYLYDDARLETEISAVFAKAFGADLIVNRFSGRVIHLHVGQRPPSTHDYNIDEAFRAAVRSLPLLHLQGDGMRAFVGCLMWGVVADYRIILIDEPEAFLHPPQARLLGRTLAKNKKAGRQLFIATHSGDVLRGVLDGASPERLRILRLVRDQTVNRVRELKPQEVASLWADPLLRQSNVLDGLFHSSAAVCEGDGDCQFYSAVAIAIAEAKDRPMPEVQFIHCGGKDRMPKVVSALRAVGVPIVAIPDFDVLRDNRPLRPLYEALGGAWHEVEKDVETVRKAVASKKAQLNADEFRKSVQSAIESISGQTVADDVLEKVRQLTKQASAWGQAKQVGEAFVPNGDPYKAYERLKTKFAAIGLHIVPVGELESFCKSIGGHGPGWVVEVIKRNLATDAELAAARTFVAIAFALN
jgi:ABC-type cobalamin/Fe3+-siderophores transport system ATPase subunit